MNKLKNEIKIGQKRSCRPAFAVNNKYFHRFKSQCLTLN